MIDKFTEKFFRGLGCEVFFSGEVLEVRKVPEKFEKFCGKKGPYRLVFSHSVEGCELVNKGSFLLKAMNDYLDNRGQTTLLKINFDFDPKEKISEIYPLMNCKIANIRRSVLNKHFTRFSFATTLQYLNEKEQLLSPIYVKDGQLVEFDLKKYNISEGNKRDIEIQNLEDDYNVAKGKVKEIVTPKIEEAKVYLKKVLDKEIERVKNHFRIQVKEIEDEIEKTKKQINSLEIEKQNLGGEEYQNALRRIENLKNNLVRLEKNEDLTRAKKEESHFIKNEIKKHTLDIKNKLMNTTILYHPIYSYDILVKGRNSQRNVNLKFDPMTGGVSKLNCQTCGAELKEIVLCSSGHLTCRDCGDRCSCCREVFCKSCFVRKCEKCNQAICGKCAVRCYRCGKFMCKTHGKVLEENGKFICNDCVKYCSSCNQPVDPINLRKDLNGRDVCYKCYSKNVGKKTLKGIFGE